VDDYLTYTVGGYVAFPNDTANDVRLSFRARGVLAYLLARPPGWRFAAARIASDGTEGREAVAAALRELAAAGYYRCHRVQTPGGFRMVTEVAALPALMPALPDPGDGFSGTGIPAPGNPYPVVNLESHNPPTPPQAGGHRGQHRNCRDCGTNRRGTKPPAPRLPPRPDQMCPCGCGRWPDLCTEQRATG
jgi:hypothetical protein